jgi:hypothetical protein
MPRVPRVNHAAVAAAASVDVLRTYPVPSTKTLQDAVTHFGPVLTENGLDRLTSRPPIDATDKALQLQFRTALEFLDQCGTPSGLRQPKKLVRSYAAKHGAERFGATRSHLANYVCNGVMIAAAWAAGYFVEDKKPRCRLDPSALLAIDPVRFDAVVDVLPY